MTHRFDLKMSRHEVTVFFQGLMNLQAFAELESLCQAQGHRKKSVPVLLGVGTTVDTEVLERLAHLDGVTVAAESQFLSRWIQRCRQQGRHPRKEQQ
jgi:hypothetical protein